MLYWRMQVKRHEFHSTKRALTRKKIVDLRYKQEMRELIFQLLFQKMMDE